MTQQSMNAPRAKRVGPAEIAPVSVGNLRIEALHWGKKRGLGQNGGYVVAYDRATGQELWVLKIYDVSYDPNMESDVQDVFIKSMRKSIFGGKLNIIDENDRRYWVDPASRTVEAR